MNSWFVGLMVMNTVSGERERERGVQGEGQQEGFCGGNGFMLGPDGG